MQSARRDEFLEAYAEPVRSLLSIGDTELSAPSDWLDYVALYGFTDEHVEALITLATDVALYDAGVSFDEGAGPVHAWRALAQMRAEAAIGPLLAAIEAFEFGGDVDLEMPTVLAMIGPAAIPQIVEYVTDRMNPPTCKGTAMSALVEIANMHPDRRGEVVGILTQLLEPDAPADELDRGFAVSHLIALKARESIEPIRAAFNEELVDISIAGDLEDVEIDLGFRKRRVTPRPVYDDDDDDLEDMFDEDEVEPPPMSDAEALRLAMAVMPSFPKIGRNEPCPCGSGKKYKKCCLP
jgi:hypothetical protein